MTFERYQAKETGFIVSARVEGFFQSRSYCDDPTAGIYIAKPPVARLTMTPVIQFANTDIEWDVSQSGSATGTISTYTLDFGDSIIPPISGAPWAGSKTGFVQYTVLGKWNAKLTVTDLLGVVSKPDIVQVQIVDIEGVIYTATIDSGAYIITAAGQTPINTGLTGGWLQFRALRLHPAFKELPPTLHHLWGCTAAGVCFSDDGGATWRLITRADMGDPPGESPGFGANLDCIDIAFNPVDWKEIVVYRSNVSSGGVWLYYSTDYGYNWQSAQVII